MDTIRCLVWSVVKASESTRLQIVGLGSFKLQVSLEIALFSEKLLAMLQALVNFTINFRIYSAGLHSIQN